MPRTPRRAFWWRFPAPSVLVFTLLMGLFPWIEIGCEGKKEDFAKFNEPNPITGKKPDRTIGANGKVVVMNQNAYQTIWGGTSPGPEIAEMEREAKKAAKEAKVEVKEKPKNREDELDAAPLVAVFFFLVVGAITVGYAMPPGLLRTLIFGGTLAVAVLVLVIQTAVGFPIQQKWEEKGGKQAKQAPGFGGPQLQLTGNIKPYCRLTVWYYLTWPFLLIPLGLVGAEELVALTMPAGKKKLKRRPAYDEDEDDRPRRRPRYEDEEDEDDRPPPRRRLAADRPAPRPRYEDEEDEAPRAKRRDPDGGARYTDGPPRRKPRVADEDEEPPRKRTRRYDDD